MRTKERERFGNTYDETGQKTDKETVITGEERRAEVWE